MWVGRLRLGRHAWTTRPTPFRHFLCAAGPVWALGGQAPASLGPADPDEVATCARMSTPGSQSGERRRSQARGAGPSGQGDMESWPEQSWVEGDWDRVEWVQEEGLNMGRLETSGHTRVQGERTVPLETTQDPPLCWMWSRGLSLICRYGGVCGVNGSTSSSLLDARGPTPSRQPPALQHSTQGSAWPSPTFPFWLHHPVLHFFFCFYAWSPNTP